MSNEIFQSVTLTAIRKKHRSITSTWSFTQICRLTLSIMRPYCIQVHHRPKLTLPACLVYKNWELAASKYFLLEVKKKTCQHLRCSEQRDTHTFEHSKLFLSPFGWSVALQQRKQFPAIIDMRRAFIFEQKPENRIVDFPSHYHRFKHWTFTHYKFDHSVDEGK